MNSNQVTEKTRDYGADCVRVLAICLLFWLHFYLRNGFYYANGSQPLIGVAAAFVPIFLACVPLFAVLTGYLKCNKPWTKRYYLSIVPILSSWLIISAICYGYKVLYLHEEKTALEWFTDLVQYQMADYSWYVGMYMGLFVLSPLLNIIWKNCKNHTQHVAVLVSIFSVTALPRFIGGITGINVLPTYFTQLIYVLYYFIGCYIATYRPKLHPAICLGAIAGLGIILSVANILTRTDPNNFYTGYSIDYTHPALIVITVCFFLLVYQANTNSKILRKIAQTIASITLEMYLISYIFDSNVYVFHRGQYGFELYIPVGLAMTAIVFACSFCSGYLVHLASTGIYRLVKRIKFK